MVGIETRENVLKVGTRALKILKDRCAASAVSLVSRLQANWAGAGSQ